jgi:hypothetical protein
MIAPVTKDSYPVQEPRFTIWYANRQYHYSRTNKEVVDAR